MPKNPHESKGPAPAIDKGIPLPVRPTRQWYRWSEMEVGDSFFIPRIVQVTGPIDHQRKKYPERTFVFQTREEHGVKGVRVWRGPDRPVKLKP